MTTLKVKFNDYGALNPNESEHDFTILSNFSEGFPKKTKYHCWWCTYQFDTPPIGLPRRIIDSSEFQVIGNFCSFGCVLAYGLETKAVKVSTGDIIYFYQKLTGKTDITYTNQKLKPAPSRYLLEKFGGRMTIEQYRKLSPEINIQIFLAPQIPIHFTVSIDPKDTSDLSIKMANMKIEEPKVPKKKTKRTTVGDMVTMSQV